MNETLKRKRMKCLTENVTCAIRGNGSLISSLPDETLMEIFVHIPGSDLITFCVFVCKRWSKIIQLQTLWKWKCEVNQGYTRDMIRVLMTTGDYITLYFNNPYNSNLIRNHMALDGLKYWHVKADGEFRVEIKSVGLQREPELQRYSGKTLHCWIPTYRNHSKVQVIDLIERGCTTNILDHVRPNIKITDWYTGHYTLRVQLLHTLQDRKPVYEFCFSIRKPLAGRLNHVHHTIMDYKAGARFLTFQHGGRQIVKEEKYDDNCTKMTLSCVQFDLSHISGSWNITNKVNVT